MAERGPSHGTPMADRPGGMDEKHRIVRFKLDRLREQLIGVPVVDVGFPVETRKGAQEEVVGRDAPWPLAPRALDLSDLDTRLDDRGHALGDPILKVEDVIKRAVEIVGPEV